MRFFPAVLLLLIPSVPSRDAPPPWRDTLLSLHRDLVSIESVTGNEASVGDFLADYLAQHAFSVSRQQLPSSGPERPRFNVLAKLGGPGPNTLSAFAAPRVVVTSHIDVVPPHMPYSISDSPPDITSHTRVGGRGSVDAKASVAAQIVALMNLADAGEIDQDSGILLLYVVGEETGGEGMKFFSKSLADADDPRPELEAAIFGEPTENKLACGHKGILICHIEARGEAGHSGYPWLSKSANELLVRALGKILDADLGNSERGGKTTVNIGKMEGGVAANVIPKHAEAELTARVAIGPEFGGGHVVKEKITKLVMDVDGDAFTLRWGQSYGFVDCKCDVEGFEQSVMNYGTDVHNLNGDHTKYLYGPGSILVAHGDHENITVADLEDAVRGYEKLVLHILGNESNSAKEEAPKDLKRTTI